jgi:uncharacterized protein (TIGR03118 family)
MRYLPSGTPARTTLRGITLLGALLLGLAAQPAQATSFTVTNLVTNNQTVNSALIEDPNLVNAWGVSHSPTSPFWVSDNGTGLATLYNVNPATNVPTPQALIVTIPGAGSVTGQVFNTAATSGAFNGDNFLFVAEDGTVAGWRSALGTTAETLQPPSAANVYKGAALATIGSNTYLYGANFRAGSIDVTKGSATAPTLPGSFTDPTLPAGYAPFNIQLLGGKLYVAYALQDGAKHDEIAGPGLGFVSVFDLNGNFLGRIASNGPLDAPWGLAIAPTSFGSFAGDLLVGNFGNGMINAFNLATDSFAGTLDAADGTPLTIDGLWALVPGNDGSAGSSQKIYFSAGPNGEADGLFGVIAAVPEPAPIATLALGLAAVMMLRRRA